MCSMAEKININDYAPMEVLRKMTPWEIYDIIDRHIQEQGNFNESDWTAPGREAIVENFQTQNEQWRDACGFLHTYCYWYGGSCQNLD